MSFAGRGGRTANAGLRAVGAVRSPLGHIGITLAISSNRGVAGATNLLGNGKRGRLSE